MNNTWYKDGLHFNCARCGNCCTGEPGTVAVTHDEVRTLAERMGLTEDQFRAMYTEARPGGKVGLREKSTGDCIFFKRPTGCDVYEQRPKQCRTWPFWERVVRSPETWEEHRRNCLGMDQGQQVPGDDIRRSSEDDGTLA